MEISLPSEKVECEHVEQKVEEVLLDKTVGQQGPESSFGH
jgi:hypothetical protein